MTHNSSTVDRQASYCKANHPLSTSPTPGPWAALGCHVLNHCLKKYCPPSESNYLAKLRVLHQLQRSIQLLVSGMKPFRKLAQLGTRS
jgi:hypothetical protein